MDLRVASTVLVCLPAGGVRLHAVAVVLPASGWWRGRLRAWIERQDAGRLHSRLSRDCWVVSCDAASLLELAGMPVPPPARAVLLAVGAELWDDEPGAAWLRGLLDLCQRRALAAVLEGRAPLGAWGGLLLADSRPPHACESRPVASLWLLAEHGLVGPQRYELLTEPWKMKKLRRR